MKQLREETGNILSLQIGFSKFTMFYKITFVLIPEQFSSSCFGVKWFTSVNLNIPIRAIFILSLVIEIYHCCELFAVVFSCLSWDLVALDSPSKRMTCLPSLPMHVWPLLLLALESLRYEIIMNCFYYLFKFFPLWYINYIPFKPYIILRTCTIYFIYFTKENSPWRINKDILISTRYDMSLQWERSEFCTACLAWRESHDRPRLAPSLYAMWRPSCHVTWPRPSVTCSATWASRTTLSFSSCPWWSTRQHSRWGHQSQYFVSL